MKKLALALLFAFTVIGLEAPSASAQGFGYAFQPFGFYQPYGVEYSTSIPAPPYFALNPPVYYGTRYARPYGISPFAAPPTTGAPSDYRAHPAAQIYTPPQEVQPSCNPYVCKAPASAAKPKLTQGEVRFNPFVDESDRIAKR